MTLWAVRQECESCGEIHVGEMRYDKAGAKMLSMGVRRHCYGCGELTRHAEEPVPDGVLFVMDCDMAWQEVVSYG